MLGLFPDLRPSYEVDGESVTLDMTSTIVMVMFAVGVAILFLGRPDVKKVPNMSVFRAGMVAAIALFGIAWMTATFISAHEAVIVDTVGGWVNDYRFLFALSVFIVAALTTSQSVATRTMVPIGLAAGLPPGLLTGMWAGGMAGRLHAAYRRPADRGRELRPLGHHEAGDQAGRPQLLRAEPGARGHHGGRRCRDRRDLLLILGAAALAVV